MKSHRTDGARPHPSLSPGEYLFNEAAALEAGARRSRRFHVNLNERVLFLERLEDILTVKRPKGRAPLNTYPGG